jgi:hypothetical protein
MAAKKKPVRKTPGNPPDSKWYATREEDRNRKQLKVYLEVTTRDALNEATKRLDVNLSRFVEEAILAHIARTK